MGKSLDSPASFRPIFISAFLYTSFYRVYSFCSLIRFSLPDTPVSALDRLTLDQILFFSYSISKGVNKPKPASRLILAAIDFSKVFNSVWHPALFHKLISAGLSSCFARWTQSFLSDRRACVVFQNYRIVAPFESVVVFLNYPFLAWYITLSSSVIFLLLCLLSSPVLFMLTTWPFGPPPPRSLLW